MIHARPEEAERLLLDLADLFRAALAGPSELPLSEELALARRYLEIEKLRFGERLRVRWTRPDPLPEALVPSLSLQPLVENAIKHGAAGASDIEEVSIAITARGENGRLRVVIENSCAAPSGRSEVCGTNTGLRNVRDRLINRFGDTAVLLAERFGVSRFRATVELPLVLIA